MALTKYSRPVTDTVEDVVYKPTLSDAMSAQFSSSFQYLTVEPAGFGTVANIALYFDPALTGGEEATMDGIVAAHDGTVIPPDGGAEDTDYDNTGSGLSATSVQGAIDELNGNVESLDAADVGADPAGTAASVVASHEAAGNPHSQYTTTVEAAAAAPVQSVNGETGVVSLDASDVGAESSGAAAAAVAAHEAAGDPHPTYTTAAEAAAAAPVQSVNGETGVVSLDASDVGADPSGAAASLMVAHESAGDPHPTYTTAAEAAAAAPVQSVNGSTGTVVLAAGDVGADTVGSAAGVQSNLDTHTGDANNPHGVDLGNLGSGDIDELNASVSDATMEGLIAEGYSGGISTTTSTTFQNKLTVNLPALAAGTYEVEISYGWNHDAANNDFEARFTFNGSQVGELHKQEPKDPQGSDPTGTTQRHYVTRKIIATIGALGAGSTLGLDYRTDASGVESSIWEASIVFRRRGN